MSYLTTAPTGTATGAGSLADQYGPPRVNKAAQYARVTLDMLEADRRTYEQSPSSARRQEAWDRLSEYDAAICKRPDWYDDLPAAFVGKAYTGRPPLYPDATPIEKAAHVAPGVDPEETLGVIQLLDHPNGSMRAGAERWLDRHGVRLSDVHRHFDIYQEHR